MTDMTDVAVIILAAGQSTRFGKGNKLLRTVNGVHQTFGASRAECKSR